MDIGKTIADARAASNMTQQEFADRLFVSRDLVSKWENSSRRPDYETLHRIAEALRIPEETLIKQDDFVFEELEACIPQGCSISRASLSALINSFLKKLPQTDTNLFIRRYYLLNSNAEIAGFYGIKQNIVRSRLSITVRKLKKYLKEELKDAKNAGV